MKTLFLSILFAVIISLSPLTPYAYEGDNKTDSTTIVRRIDFSGDSIMQIILKDATDAVRNGGRPAYYTLSMGEYKDGTMIRIEKSDSDIFETRGFPFAYTIVNNQLIVCTSTGNYKIIDTSPKETKTIKIARMEDRTDITDILFYFKFGDVYAKFSTEAGWLWSDGKPDE